MLLAVSIIVAVVVCAVIAGALLADHLAPKGRGAASYALPVAADATPLDRELRPLLAAHPGQTGAVLINGGLDAFAARALATRAAGRSLDLQYYIWHGDLCGHLLAQEARRASMKSSGCSGAAVAARTPRRSSWIRTGGSSARSIWIRAQAC